MYEFTPADPTRKRPGHEPPVLADKQRILFIYIPIVWFASGMSAIVLFDSEFGGFVSFMLGFGVNVLGLMWTKRDAEERGYALSQAFPIAVVIFGVFAILYYLFRSRGAQGGFRATGWLLLYVVAMSIALLIASLIVTAALVTVGLLPESIFEPK
jgi:hypothetical protein